MANLKNCPQCYDTERQRTPTRGCVACHGTGMHRARYCDSCRFMYPYEECREDKTTGLHYCPDCRSEEGKMAMKGRRR